MNDGKAPAVSVHVKAGQFIITPYIHHKDFVVRAATSDMAKELAVFEQRIFPLELYGNDVLSASKFLYFIKRSNGFVLALRKDVQILGYAVLLFKKNSNIARLYALALDENLRGMGMGKLIMSVVENLSRDLGCEAISLETRSDNISMQALCSKEGYIHTNTIKEYYFDKMDAYKFHKVL